MNRVLATAFAICGLFAILPRGVFAQAGGFGDNALLNREVTTVKGTLEMMRGGMLQVKGEDGRAFLVKAPEDMEKVRYTNTGVPAMLQPGMFVRFEGEFDARGQAVSPLRQIEVFTPYRPKHATPEIMMTMTPGLYPAGDGGAGGGGDGLFEDGGKKNRSRNTAPQTATYKVIAKVGAVGKKGVGFMAGRTMVMAPVAEDAQISVNSIGWNLARPGDQVQVTGFYVPPEETKVLGDTVRIMGATPLGVVPEKPKPTRGNAKDKDQEAEKPAAEAEAKPAE